MDNQTAYERITEILGKIDRKALPGVYRYLTTITRHGEVQEDDLYKVAARLVELSRRRAFPRFLADFVVELFEAAIEQGNDCAMNDLGARYYSGDGGFEQSFEKAVYYYNMAAEHGNRQAQENLGYCYYYGRNMEVDYEKAFHYFALGAFDGHLISLYKIGDMYLNGYYVKKNPVEAFNIYNHCLNTMTDEASRYVSGPVHLRLGDMFLNGVGTKRDPQQALLHYNLAEIMLLQMVRDGDYMYKKSLQSAIEGQKQARERLADELPGQEWTFDD